MTEREPTDLERAVARAIGCEMNQDYDGLIELLRNEPNQIIAAGQVRRLERFARAAIAECFRRRPMETAPKDETWIFLLSVNGTWHVGKWDAEGTSWVDEAGEPSDEAHDLAVTGVWASADGWFQPNEVAGWMPIPPPSPEDEP